VRSPRGALSARAHPCPDLRKKFPWKFLVESCGDILALRPSLVARPEGGDKAKGKAIYDLKAYDDFLIEQVALLEGEEAVGAPKPKAKAPAKPKAKSMFAPKAEEEEESDSSEEEDDDDDDDDEEEPARKPTKPARAAAKPVAISARVTKPAAKSAKPAEDPKAKWMALSNDDKFKSIKAAGFKVSLNWEDNVVYTLVNTANGERVEISPSDVGYDAKVESMYTIYSSACAAEEMGKADAMVAEERAKFVAEQAAALQRFEEAMAGVIAKASGSTAELQADAANAVAILFAPPRAAEAVDPETGADLDDAAAVEEDGEAADGEFRMKSAILDDKEAAAEEEEEDDEDELEWAMTKDEAEKAAAKHAKPSPKRRAASDSDDSDAEEADDSPPPPTKSAKVDKPLIITPQGAEAPLAA